MNVETRQATESAWMTATSKNDLILGRSERSINLASAAAGITGKRVLVTGAGGSIGSELSRRLITLAPANLILFDRDESALVETVLSLDPHPDSTVTLALGDVRSDLRIESVFREHLPEAVFHAAALKHVPILEANPDEAYQTNVLGTWHLLQAASRFPVARFVNVSTDKAADPCSVLGYSKRIAERLTTWFGEQCPSTTFVSVRFGNVLDSRGSVLEVFHRQAQRGLPITITDDRATRYLMTIREAASLMIYASSFGRTSEIMVLRMGEPVSITKFVDEIERRDGHPVQVKIIGLRSGERLHERLTGSDEVLLGCEDDSVWRVQGVALDPRLLPARASDTASREDLFRLACADSSATIIGSESGVATSSSPGAGGP